MVSSRTNAQGLLEDDKEILSTFPNILIFDISTCIISEDSRYTYMKNTQVHPIKLPNYCLPRAKFTLLLLLKYFSSFYLCDNHEMHRDGCIPEWIQVLPYIYM